MRAMFFVFCAMILVSCSNGVSSKGPDEVFLEDSGIEDSGVTDSEKVQDSEEPGETDSGDIQETDSQVVDTDSEEPPETDSEEPEDTDSGDIQDTDSEDPVEECTFGEKGSFRCIGNAIARCQEDPNSSTIQMVWIVGYECVLGTECKEYKDGILVTPYCDLVGECVPDTFQCTEAEELQECIFDEGKGGGFWQTQEDCGATDQLCFIGISDPRCVDLDFEYCYAPGEVRCKDDKVWECQVDHWVVVDDCVADNQACGSPHGNEAFCYDRCAYHCVDKSMCEVMLKGKIVYGAGECLGDREVCCDFPTD